MTLILSRDDIRDLIRMQDVIDAVEAAHAAHAAGNAIQPTRATVSLPGTTSAILPMAATLDRPPAAGLKLLSIFPTNRDSGIPVLNAVVLLVDPSSGRCAAMLEGGVLTAFRTAAASAVATRYLARDNARILGLVGAGIEARTHFEAICHVRPRIDQVRVWSRTKETAQGFAQEMAHHGVEIEVVETPEAATRGVDILCTLTPAQEPIIQGEWFSPGLHVNAVGTHWINYREIDTKAVARSRVVVDSREAAMAECGDLMIPVREGAISTGHFADELGQLINGEREGRMSLEEITMYQSVGVAIQDVATAALLTRLAYARGVGTEVELW